MRRNSAQLSSTFIQFGFILWFFSTIIFIIADGWHIFPVRTSETVIYFIVITFFVLGGILHLMAKNDKLKKNKPIKVLIISKVLETYYDTDRIYLDFPPSAIPSEHNMIEIASAGHPDNNLFLRVIKRHFLIIDGEVALIKLECLV